VPRGRALRRRAGPPAPRWAAPHGGGARGPAAGQGSAGRVRPALCALWLLARRLAAPGSAPRAVRPGWASRPVSSPWSPRLASTSCSTGRRPGSLLAVLPRPPARRGRGGGRGVGLAARPTTALYLGRVLWFPFPWSLALVVAACTSDGSPGAPAGRQRTSRPPAEPWPGVCSRSRPSSCTWACSGSPTAAPIATSPRVLRGGRRGRRAALGASARLRRLAAALDRPWCGGGLGRHVRRPPLRGPTRPAHGQGLGSLTFSPQPRRDKRILRRGR